MRSSGVSARSNRLFEKNEMLACIALAGQSSSPRRLPTIERHRNADFVRRSPSLDSLSG